MNESRARQCAIEIIYMFEDLLDKKGIMIPSGDREGRRDEASIYGWDYVLV